MDADSLLTAYDDQLRGDAETAGAVAATRLGPLHLVTFPGEGFVTYPHLSGAAGAEIRGLVSRVVDHYRADPTIHSVEWKTRSHDHTPGLHEALLAHGFQAEQPESIMVGRATDLAVDVSLPEGVTLRRITDEADVRAMTVMVAEVFGNDDRTAEKSAAALLRRLATGDGTELWVAEADGSIVCAGRLEPVAGTDFASIWGGATRSDWRRRGLYRAVTAARARSALALGKTFVHSDSSEDSRPILERSGLVRVATTTPYEWER